MNGIDSLLHDDWRTAVRVPLVDCCLAMGSADHIRFRTMIDDKARLNPKAHSASSERTAQSSPSHQKQDMLLQASACTLAVDVPANSTTGTLKMHVNLHIKAEIASQLSKECHIECRAYMQDSILSYPKEKLVSNAQACLHAYIIIHTFNGC
jgi:hypothetical protein